MTSSFYGGCLLVERRKVNLEIQEVLHLQTLSTCSDSSAPCGKGVPRRRLAQDKREVLRKDSVTSHVERRKLIGHQPTASFRRH